MKNTEFAQIRHLLGKTQGQLARCLCVSTKAIQSFEQGWRNIPPSAERQLLFLLSLNQSQDQNTRPCWDVKECSTGWRGECIVWELKAGQFCWFLNGTYCQGKSQRSWAEKVKICRECEVFKPLIA